MDRSDKSSAIRASPWHMYPMWTSLSRESAGGLWGGFFCGKVDPIVGVAVCGSALDDLPEDGLGDADCVWVCVRDESPPCEAFESRDRIERCEASILKQR